MSDPRGDWEGLLGAAQTGAPWAWDRLYQDLAPPVRGYLVAQGAADPDDLLGEVWLHVARGVARFGGDESAFRSWVFMIAHHRVVDERRRRGRRPESAPGDADDWAGTTPAAEDDALAGIATEEVVALLARLTDDQRDVLTLRILGDLTVEQVAAATGRRPGAVKALQRRALRSLQKILLQAVPL